MPFEDSNNRNENMSYNNTQTTPDISYVPYAEDNSSKWDFSSMSINKTEPSKENKTANNDSFDIEAAVRSAYPNKEKTRKIATKQKIVPEEQRVSKSQARTQHAQQQREQISKTTPSASTTQKQAKQKIQPQLETKIVNRQAEGTPAKVQKKSQPVQQQKTEKPQQERVSKLIKKQAPSKEDKPAVSKQQEKTPDVQKPVNKEAIVVKEQGSIAIAKPQVSLQDAVRYTAPENQEPQRQVTNEIKISDNTYNANMPNSSDDEKSAVNTPNAQNDISEQFVPKLAVNPEKVSSAMDDRLSLLQGANEIPETTDKKKKKRHSKKDKGSSLFSLGKKSKNSEPLSEDEWQGQFDEVISDFHAQDLEQQRKEAIAQIPKSERIKNNIIAAIKEPVVIIALIVVLFVVFVQKSFLVPSGSMVPTLIENDRIFTIKSYITDGQTFKPGDIVCFYAPNSGEVYVKRVIANGGSTVEISGDEVYVNGELSPYQGKGTGSIQGKWELAEDEYFVMGDNRSNSKDSRYSEVGPIKADAMISRVVAIYWPFDDAKLLIDNPYPSES